MKRPLLLAFMAFALAACTVSDRYVAPTPQTTQSQPIAFRAVELREVSLPAYAASDEIAVLDADGRIASGGAVLWADTPDRAVALELTRHLSQITRARVASAPWPFEAFPDARLDVRFETFVARADGQFEAAGQYFVAVPDGGRERSGFFRLTVAYDIDGGPAAIAAARGQIVLELAAFIARDGMR